MNSQIQSLYFKSDSIIEISAKDIIAISDDKIELSNGKHIVFRESKQHFPYGPSYVAARFPHRFWQFFDEGQSTVILCENMKEYNRILSHIGYLHSFDLS